MNLLPEQHKRAVYREYFLRLLVVALLLSTLLVLAGAVFLLPSYVVTMGKQDSLAVEDARLKEAIAKTEKDPSRAGLMVLEEKLSLLATARNDTTLESILQVAISQRPKGISITSFSWRRGTPDKGVFTIKGIAANRETLVSFTRVLEATEIFASVTLPVSNLAASTDIAFTISMDSTVRPSTP